MEPEKRLLSIQEESLAVVWAILLFALLLTGVNVPSEKTTRPSSGYS